MKRDEFRKYFYLGFTAFMVVVCSILFFFCIFRMDALKTACQLVVSILNPILYGLIIGYLLNPVYNYLRRKLFAYFKQHMKEARAIKLAKGLSITISLLLLIVIVIGLLRLVIPQVIASIFGIGESLPKNMVKLSRWIEDLLQNNPQLEDIVMGFYNEAASYLEDWIRSFLLPSIEMIFTGVSNSVIGVLVALKNILIGLIVAIYVMASKERFAAQSKKLIYSIFKPEQANEIVEEMRYVHKVFGGFIVGKLLDSAIIGVITFFAMTFLKLPYPMLISVIIGVTNIIPFFGPFIGAAPSIIIILMVSPMQAVYFTVYVIILQQFDGNILGPKILGDSTGLSSFWVMFAILFFGGIMGFVGMIIGVPTFAIIYHLISKFVNKSLAARKLSTETMDYLPLKEIQIGADGQLIMENLPPEEEIEAEKE